MKYLCAVLFFLGSMGLAQAQAVTLMTEEFAPYQFYQEGDTEVSGISIEIVKAIQTALGDKSEIKVLPWSRGLKLLAKKKNAALFSTARTPARKEKYKWVGPLAKLEMVFFKKAGSPVTFSSLEEAKKLGKIGVTKNVATHEILTNMGFTNLDVMQSGSDDKNLKRLTKGRIDAWPTAYYAGVYSAKQAGVLDQIEAVPGVVILSGSLYMAFNKESDDAVVQAWQEALDRLRASGAIEAILKKYDR